MWWVYTVPMRKRWIILGVALLLCVILFVYLKSRPEAPAIESAVVERGAVEHIVSVTGRVEPVDRVRLAFEQGGRVSEVLIAG
jgi:multidrug efflux pump subunit AcrA (membrane-fusion protein)